MTAPRLVASHRGEVEPLFSFEDVKRAVAVAILWLTWPYRRLLALLVESDDLRPDEEWLHIAEAGGWYGRVLSEPEMERLSQAVIWERYDRIMSASGQFRPVQLDTPRLRGGHLERAGVAR